MAIELKDVGAKIMSKDEKLWDTVKNICESKITECENEIKIQSEMLKVANAKLKKKKHLLF